MNIELTLPENWNQVISNGRYLDVIRILTGEGDAEQKRLDMVAMLCNMDGYNLGLAFGAANGKQRKKIDDFELLQLADGIKRLALPEIEWIFTNTPFIVNPIPSFAHQGKAYKGLADKLSNQTGAQWMVSHQQQVLWQKSKDVKHLHIVLAANYLQINPAGQVQEFNEESMMAAAEAFANLPQEIVYGFYLWYQHADDWWFTRFKHLFDGELEGEKKPAPNGMEVRDIVWELAGGTIGTEWDVLKLRSRQDIFYNLDRLHKKAIERKKQLEALKNK